MSEQWETETANFRAAGSPAPTPAPIDMPAPKAEPEAKAGEEAKPEAVDTAVIDAGKDGKNGKEPEPNAESEDAAAQKAVEGGLPEWMKKRIERANKKEDEATRRVAEAERKAQEALDRLAAFEAKQSKPAPTEAPDPDDFDTVKDYEAAKAEWKKAQEKPKAEEPKKDEKKAEEPKLNLPPGTTADEYTAIETSIKDNLSAETKAAMLKLPVLTETHLIAIHDIADGDPAEMEKVAQFMSASPSILSEVAKLPARRQFSTLERAYQEYNPKPIKDEVKKNTKTSSAPPPISRSKGTTPAADGDSFTDFEAARNAEELERGRKPY